MRSVAVLDIRVTETMTKAVRTMSSEHKLVCRECGESEKFPTLRAMEGSGWIDVSVFGVTIDIALQEHDGTCPDCRDDGKWKVNDSDEDSDEDTDSSEGKHIYGGDPRHRGGPL
jgi:hypothetical protein